MPRRWLGGVQAQECDQGEVVDVGRQSGGGDQGLELQVPEAEGGRLGHFAVYCLDADVNTIGDDSADTRVQLWPCNGTDQQYQAIRPFAESIIA